MHPGLRASWCRMLVGHVPNGLLTSASLGRVVMVEFQLLGAVVIRVEGTVLDLGRPQQQLLAAALAVDAIRSVTTDGLIDRIWDDPPSGARRTLHVLVTRLRRILEQAASPDVAPRV